MLTFVSNCFWINPSSKLRYKRASSSSTLPPLGQSTPRRVLRCCSQNQGRNDSGTIPTENPNIPSRSDFQSNNLKKDEPIPSRTQLAREAREAAEQLKLQAQRARLDLENAELLAEKKRDELKRFQAKAGTKRNEPQPTVYDEESSSQPKIPSNVTQIPTPAKFTPQTITDLVGIDFPRVSEEDIETIKEHVCGMKTFFITEIDRAPFSERVVFRGNLRLESETALEKLEELANAHGLKNRVRLFLLLDPKEDNSDPKKPVLVALPAEVTPNKANLFSTGLAAVTAAITVTTTFAYGVGIFGLTPSFIDEISRGNFEEFYYSFPISTGILAITVAHELAHRFAAKLRNVQLGPPFCIPSLQIGSFGTITPLESHPRLRKDLFDVAFSGPFVGMIASIATLLAGLVLTAQGGIAEWYPQIPSSLFHASILVGVLADTILPPGLREQASVAVHPLTVVGYTGLLVNSLNLLPIGRLDGGRIVQALFGRPVATRISSLTLILTGFSSIFGNSPLLLFWGLVCVFLQRESEYPCQNEIVEPDDNRAFLGLSLLFLMLFALVPFPNTFGKN